MSFKDKYPRICPEICPRCKKSCMHKMEKHADENGIPTAHVCGPHWWVRFSAPDCMEISASGYVGLRRVKVQNVAN